MNFGRWALLVCAAVGLLASAACDDGPTAPTPTPTPTPTPPPFTLACPPDLTAISHLNQPARVSWTEPTSANGVAPVTVVCTPASGSGFSGGTTTVQCRGTDAAGHAADCAFWVTVTRIPVLSVTRLVAFGDSLTEGKISDPISPWLLLPNDTWSYPFLLNGLLAQRYTDQAITVVNEGLGGEKVNAGYYRLQLVLARDSPQALLLLEGANDLTSGGGDAVSTIIGGLQSMVHLAKTANVQVLLSTFPPERAGGYLGTGAAYVPEINARIADLARRENVILVDTYTGFPADTRPVVGADGLHLTKDGYALMARIFFDSITSRLETVAPTAAAGSPALDAPVGLRRLQRK